MMIGKLCTTVAKTTGSDPCGTVRHWSSLPRGEEEMSKLLIARHMST